MLAFDRQSHNLLKLEHHAGLNIEPINYENLPQQIQLCT